MEALSRLALAVLLCAACQSVSSEGGPAAPDVAVGSARDIGGLDASLDAADGTTPAFDHRALDALVKDYVKGGCVDYAAMASTASTGVLLDGYVASLAGADPASFATADDRLAFWLNAYNAFTLEGILAGLEADARFSTAGPDRNTFTFFSGPTHAVAGQALTLDQIEHGVVRGDFTREDMAPHKAALEPQHLGVFADGQVDARIHAGFNCGAQSCPSLPAEAFDGGRLQAQLEAGARAWVNDADRGASADGISRLFDWFGADFRSWIGGVDKFIERYHDAQGAGVDLGTYKTYVWELNACL